jgi:sugar phosphate permease
MIGFGVLFCGIVGVTLCLLPAVPLAVFPIVWGVGGFGIGSAYSPLSILMLHDAPPDEAGSRGSSLNLAENLGISLAAGAGGAAVATAASNGHQALGVAVAFSACAALAATALAASRRLPHVAESG